MRTFLLGMVVVPIALFGQIIVNHLVLENRPIDFVLLFESPLIGILAILLWAAIEEALKFKAAYFGGLNTDSNDEPKDVMVYVITAALGFAALENALFLFSPILEGDTVTALITTNMRFIGATLVHVTSSSMIGMFRAYGYFFNKEKKAQYTFIGFIIAVSLHTIFNLSIIKYQDKLFGTFFIIWIIVLLVILIFEKIKNIHLNRIQ